VTPWQKIMRAYYRQTGLRLTRDEINRLGQDGAIETRACNAAFEEDRCTVCWCLLCRCDLTFKAKQGSFTYEL
jgi:hypothetical protein